jgi:hypothetical protein
MRPMCRIRSRCSSLPYRGTGNATDCKFGWQRKADPLRRTELRHGDQTRGQTSRRPWHACLVGLVVGSPTRREPNPWMIGGSGDTPCEVRRVQHRDHPCRISLPDVCHARSAPCWSSGANVDVLRPQQKTTCGRPFRAHAHTHHVRSEAKLPQTRVTHHRLAVGSFAVASRAKRSASDGGGRTRHTMRDSTAPSTTPTQRRSRTAFVTIFQHVNANKFSVLAH